MDGRRSAVDEPGWMRRALWAILVVALVNGLIHVFLVPPWQHYDEPGHFEYVWLVADRWKVPHPRQDYDLTMERDVISSMVEYDFYVDLGSPPPLLSDAGRIWLPMPQTHDPPLYYFLAAPAMYLVRHADTVTQLYAARLASLVLYLLTVWMAYRLVAELVPGGHPLRIAVPGMLALLPAFVDLMTAINNDVGAVAVFTFFLWGGVRWLVRGFSLGRLLWILGATAAAVLTKNTSAIAVPLLGFLGVVIFLRRRWSLRRLALFVGVGAGALVAVFGWGDAAYWYRDTDQPLPLRQRVEEAPLGEHALALEVRGDAPGRRVRHFLLSEQMTALRGQTVTLGAWIWASRPITVRSPEIAGRWKRVEVGTTPTFVANTVPIPQDARWVGVTLRPLVDRDLAEPAVVYYDGLTLALGERPLDEPPRFDDADGRTGVWGGETFVNLIRNPSVEQGWPWLRPTLVRWLQLRPLFLPASVYHIVGAALDWERTGWVYPGTARRLLQSFWAVFRWGGLTLDPWWYTVLTFLTGVGLVGALVRLVVRGTRYSPEVRWALLFLGLAAGISWGLAMLRPLPLYPWEEKPFIPVARYVYPSIVPTALALVAGWTVGFRGRWPWWILGGLLLGMVVLNVASLARMVAVFYPS